MTWQEIKALRDSGKYQEAVDRGIQLLADNPGDFKLRTQIDWAWYGLVRMMVAGMTAKLDASQPVPNSETEKLWQELRRYGKQPKRRGDSALSNILRELSKVSSYLPGFSAFVHWVGIDGLSSEDWQYQSRNDHEFPPIGLGVARALTKWVMKFPDQDTAHVERALQWAQRARSVARGDDALWLDWDLVRLLRRLNKQAQAAELMGKVIKAKRNDFWTWAEAARLYVDDQPDLALACACRALECDSDPIYKVKVHRELAQMLAEREEFAQASREVAIAVAIRQEQKWKIDAHLQKLINSIWYDPTAPDAEDPKTFYASHSQQALVLIFDVVEEKPATYLGTFIPHIREEVPPKKKVRPLPMFAVRGPNGTSSRIAGFGIRRPRYKVGDPVTIVLGKQIQERKESIIQIRPRSEGEDWDCTDQGSGVVIRESAGDKNARVFICRDKEESDMDSSTWLGPLPPLLGQGVRFRLTQDPKTSRKHVFAVETGPLPEDDVRLVYGRLQRNPKGFAFVDDAFIAPHLIEKLDLAVEDVAAIAVYGRHPTKSENSWRAIKVSPVFE